MYHGQVSHPQAEIDRSNVLKEFWGTGEVVLPRGLRAIDSRAFQECSGVTGVILPDTVWRIGKCAFYGCRKLRHIHIPDSVTRIESGAFIGCHLLESIRIPDAVTHIDEKMFIGCRKLANADGLVIVRDTLYDYFGSSDEVTIPAQVKHIRGGLFRSLSVGTVHFDGCAEIGADAFPANTCFLAPNQRLSGFVSAQDKHRAVATFLRYPEVYQNSEIAREYRDYAIRQRRHLLEWAFAADEPTVIAFYAEAGKITAENFSPVYLEPASAAGAAACVAALMEWKHTHGTETEEAQVKRMSRAMLRDPYSVSEVKKNWQYASLPDGTMMLTGYKGSDSVVQIPPRVGKCPVTALDSWLMGERDNPEKKQRRQRIRNVFIPEGITSIGAYAFYDCPNLEEVEVPASVTAVGCDVFSECPKMNSNGWIQRGHVLFACSRKDEEIVVPDTVTVLAAEAFRSGRNRRVVLHDNIRHIGKGLFQWSHVEQVRLPSGLMHFPERMFYDCIDLQTLENLPEGAWTAGPYAFKDCKGLCNPDGLLMVGTVLWSYVGKASEVVVPDGVTRIAPSAFAYKQHLQSVTLPSSVTHIGAAAFCDCSRLRELNVPDDVQLENTDAFADCDALVDASGGMLIVGGVLCRCRSKAQKIVVPDGVTRIAGHAFEENEPITEVVLPDSVTEIGASAFYQCCNLEKINLPSGLLHIGDGAFEQCWALRSVKIPSGITRIGESTFRHCAKLHPVLPEGLTYIGAQAFEECRSMTTRRLPEGVTKIGARAFAGCASIRSMLLPEGLTDIGREAFRDCTALSKINAPTALKTIGTCAFKNCRLLADGDGAVCFGNILFDHCGKDEKYVMPHGLTRIDAEAFSGRKNLAVIMVSDSVTEIGNGAFASCAGLRHLHLPSGVRKFGSRLFDKNADVTIHAPSGSKAIAYADRVGLPFEIIPVR